MSENWVPCVLDIDYEINTVFPNQIRKISTGRIIKEYQESDGYIRCCLNNRKYLKHRIVATQFIPNPNGYTVVDHINRIRTDNRIENLRWVSQSENCKNKSSSMGVTYTIIEYDDKPDDLIPVDHYNNHVFEGYYYSPENNKFYFDTGVNIRQLHVCFDDNIAFVWVKDVNKKRVKICYNKFKRIYGFQ